MPISLYDCLNAKWPNDSLSPYIYCSKGHKLSNGKIHTRQVNRGDKLICRVCQICKDFEGFDKPYEM